MLELPTAVPFLSSTLPRKQSTIKRSSASASLTDPHATHFHMPSLCKGDGTWQ